MCVCGGDREARWDVYCTARALVALVTAALRLDGAQSLMAAAATAAATLRDRQPCATQSRAARPTRYKTTSRNEPRRLVTRPTRYKTGGLVSLASSATARDWAPPDTAPSLVSGATRPITRYDTPLTTCQRICAPAIYTCYLYLLFIPKQRICAPARRRGVLVCRPRPAPPVPRSLVMGGDPLIRLGSTGASSRASAYRQPPRHSVTSPVSQAEPHSDRVTSDSPIPPGQSHPTCGSSPRPPTPWRSPPPPGAAHHQQSIPRLDTHTRARILP